nr:hypothetical protein [Tanacetum cinerariifolium]
MRSDELYKFSDGTLTSVRYVLHDIASNLRMDYLPKRRWSNLDKQRSHIMIKAIDKLQLERRLMRIDELHKFSDGTLNDVRNALDDRLKGIRMQYLSSTIWRKGDKDRAAVMIQAIEKMLKPRRIMRSLEKFVGGRLYEGDMRMLQRTI